MVHKNLLDVLAKGGLNKDGEAFTVPSGLLVTVYLDLGHESLIVDRVVRCEVGPEIAALVTHRKERYVVELDTITAIRFHPEGSAAGYA